MFRALFRRPRTIRVPIENANIDFQRVNVIQQPKQFKSRPAFSQFMLTGVAMFLTIQGMKYLDPFGQHQNRDSVPDQIDKAPDTEANGDKTSRYGKHWDAQHARMKSGEPIKSVPEKGSQDLMRLTVPIWFRKGPSRPYSPMDPVFKEYEKLQSDKKRVSDLQTLVAESVYKAMQASGAHMHELKLIAFNDRVETQLDIVPQLLAPPLYQVPCLWISSGSLPEYGWRTLSPNTGAKLERVFRPLALFQAATTASQFFVYTVWIITKAKYAQILHRVKGTAPSTRSPPVTIPMMPPLNKPQKSADSSEAEVTKSSTPIFPFLPDLSDARGTRQMHQDVVSAMPYSLAIKQAVAAFNHVKMHKQGAAAATNVRGACQIRGFLRFNGERGQFRMDISVWYLPSENIFLGNIEIKQRYLIFNYAYLSKEYERRLKLSKEAVEKHKQLKEAEQLAPPGPRDDNSSDNSTAPADPKDDGSSDKSTSKDDAEK